MPRDNAQALAWLDAWSAPPPDPTAACWHCAVHVPVTPGEWQCPDCARWWYVPPGGVPERVYDRERLPEQLTAQEQVQILQATLALEARGQRYGVHFGWQTAVQDAAWWCGGRRR